jgi:hypothetical protein
VKWSTPNTISVDHLQITTSMHRRAGSQRECVQAVTDGALYDITDMREWREEKGSGVVTLPRLAGRARLSSAVLPVAPVTLSPACKIRRFLKRPASRPSGAAHCGKALARCHE